MKTHLLITALLAFSHAAVQADAVKKEPERTAAALRISVYDGRHKRVISFADFVERLQEANIVCFGEIHENEMHHHLQAQLIKALFERDKRLGVGMEIFQRPFQKVVDEYLAGTISEEALLKGTDYEERWGYEWELYRPIVELCRRNRIPLAALNAPQELTRQVSKVGFDGLKAADKEQLAGIDFHVKAHRDYWYDYLSPDAKPEANERWYQVMTVWDGYMAASAAAFQQSRNVHRMLIIAGSGHIEYGFGIPNRAAQRTGGRVLTIGVEAGAYQEPTDPATDFVVFVE